MLPRGPRDGVRLRGTPGKLIRAVQNREFYDGELVPGTRYRVVGLVGVGGMGTVYEVEHVELGKRFVLKALLRELSRRQDLVQRLRNEWRALGRLEHPNIVNVTDAGTTPTGVPYYVMERLEGETLSSRLRRARRLPITEALHIAAGLLDGLSAAHEIGIVHRDIKPPNIFLVADGRTKVLDFGVAKMADAAGAITARGMAVGTPRYMAPEQARGNKVDGRSDLYAAGLVLFEMIAGVGPFDDARDPNEMLIAHLAREAPRVGSLVMGVLAEVDEVVASLLAKDARERPESARELAATLRAIITTYAQRVSTSAITPAAHYSASTVQVNVDPTTQQLNTRPDGLAANAATSSALTTAVQRGLPLPPQAYAEGPASAAMISQPTWVDSTGSLLTQIAEPPVPPSSASKLTPVTTRFGTAELARAGGWRASGRSERLPEPTFAGVQLETRTRVPAAETPSLSTPIPVVPSGRSTNAKPRGGMLGYVALFALGFGLLGWLVAAPRKPVSSAAALPPPAAATPDTSTVVAVPAPDVRPKLLESAVTSPSAPLASPPPVQPRQTRALPKPKPVKRSSLAHAAAVEAKPAGGVPEATAASALPASGL